MRALPASILSLSLSALPALAADFSHQIVPILREHCLECHSSEKKKGGFSLNSKQEFLDGSENGKVVDSAAPLKSHLLEVIFSDDSEKVMPPPAKDKSKPRPTAAQLALLKEWVLGGAPWEEGFVFKRPAYIAPIKPRLPELPPVTKGREHPLDRLMDRYYASQGVSAPPKTDDASFARRVWLDLTGLLPTPQELQSFLSHNHPQKRTQLVQILLARNTAYAEHWLTFWNDLLRNDYGGTGFITGGRKQVSQWLYQCLVSNTPYDEMVRALVNPNADTEGFAQGITWRGNVSASQTREVQYAQSISQSFLGINMKCASCHDSFIDRWKLSDAYGLAAVFSEKPIEMARCEKLTGKIATPSWPFPEIGKLTPDAPRAERLRQLADLMTHPDNGWMARTIVNRLWANLMGRGLVHPVDAMGTAPWSEDVLDYLGWHLAQNRFNLKATLELIATSEAYQAQARLRTKGDDTARFVFQGPWAKRLTAEQFVDLLWQITETAPQKIDAPVRRGSHDARRAAAIPLSAQWIQPAPAPTPADPKAVPAPKGKLVVFRKTLPLDQKPTRVSGISVANARILINGTQLAPAAMLRSGDVLDVQSGGAWKKGENSLLLVLPQSGNPTAWLQFQITLPDGKTQWLNSDASWEVASGIAEDAFAKNKLNPESETWKAAQWLPAATLTTPPAQPTADALRKELDVATAPELPARAALLKSDLLMRALGRPNRDQIVTNRPQDLSTLEAIDLSAGERLSQLITAGATKLTSKPLGSNAELVDWIYSFALARQPNAQEKSAALELLGSTTNRVATEDLLWAVLMLPEFQLVR
jgi:hypothetical protein